MASHIRGTVDSRLEPIVAVCIHDCFGLEYSIDAVIDTGYSGELTLPSDLIAFLSLPLSRQQRTQLADGSIQVFDLHDAEVKWDGQWKSVLALSVGEKPLIGMRLLLGHHLSIDAIVGGSIEIQPIP